MTSKLCVLFLTQCLISKAISSYIHPYAVKQYSAAYSPGPQKMPPSYSPVTYSSDYRAYYSDNQYPHKYYPSYPKLTEAPPILPKENLEAVRQYTTTELQPPTAQASAPNIESVKRCSEKIDSNVLNNLAIALQLLIVNNILNNPPETLDVTPVNESIKEIVFPSGNSRETMQMPNSKFLGSSGFGQDLTSSSMLGSYGISTNTPLPSSPRQNNLNLMSPYDAIAKSTPISESLVSSFLAKNDFQSPYAAIMAADANADLFSMSDLFS